MSSSDSVVASPVDSAVVLLPAESVVVSVSPADAVSGGVSPSVSPLAFYTALMATWWDQAKAQWQSANLPTLNLSLSPSSITATEWILIGLIIFLGLMVLFLAYIIRQKNKLIAHMHLGTSRYKRLAEYSNYLDQ